MSFFPLNDLLVLDRISLYCSHADVTLKGEKRSSKMKEKLTHTHKKNGGKISKLTCNEGLLTISESILQVFHP